MGHGETIAVQRNTEELLRRVIGVLRPPPMQTLSQWADEKRVISANAAAEPGRWHTEKAPYQREIMDAIGDPRVPKVVVMSAAQIGKTDAFILNTIGYYMDYAPATMMVMQPTVEMGEVFSKERLAPMLRETPCLKGKVEEKSRTSGNTIRQKSFAGGSIAIVGANSPSSLASRPVKVLLADEVDRYPASAEEEGDPVLLAEKRQTTFWDKKTVLISTPTNRGDSRIEKEFENSTREEWTVPCPHCGHYQPLAWANLDFSTTEGEIVYRCERCGVPGGEYEWKQAGQRGRYEAENPGAAARGFHLNTLASSFCSWKDVVDKFKEAKRLLDLGDVEQMKVWVNTELGQTWEQRGETIDAGELIARREVYAAPVPDGVIYLTAGVDVQDDRFEVEIVGWGAGKESWGIRYLKIYGDLLKPAAWEDLDFLLSETWQKRDGTRLGLLAACIDTGGHFTDTVYRFCKERYGRRIYAIKGRGGEETPYTRNPSKDNRVKVPLFVLGVDRGKELVYARLKHQTVGPNYCHFPLNEGCGYDETYFKGLTAEKQEITYKHGRQQRRWVLKDRSYKRNEPLDLRNYAQAALEIANPPLEGVPTPRKALAAQRTRVLSRGVV